MPSVCSLLSMAKLHFTFLEEPRRKEEVEQRKFSIKLCNHKHLNFLFVRKKYIIMSTLNNLIRNEIYRPSLENIHVHAAVINCKHYYFCE